MTGKEHTFETREGRARILEGDDGGVQINHPDGAATHMNRDQFRQFKDTVKNIEPAQKSGQSGGSQSPTRSPDRA